MKTKQINLKLPENLLKTAQLYAKQYGFKNVQELAAESMREKIFEKDVFDETFSDKEIELIDKLTEVSIAKKHLGTEKELLKALK